jgi:uncharacterized protein (DUF4415 family)
MSEKSTITTGRDTDDVPPRFTRAMAERGRHVIGDVVLREAKPRGRPRKAEGERKEAVSIRLSADVLSFFRSTGDGWQTRIDKALRDFVGSQLVQPSTVSTETAPSHALARRWGIVPDDEPGTVLPSEAAVGAVTHSDPRSERLIIDEITHPEDAKFMVMNAAEAGETALMGTIITTVGGRGLETREVRGLKSRKSRVKAMKD